MKAHLKLTSAVLLTGLQLAGCTSMKGLDDNNICFSDSGEVVECSEQTSSLPVEPTNPNSIYSPEKADDPTLFNSKTNFVLLSEYVEQMAMDLERNLPGHLSLPVAVTSFVTLDSTLKNTTLLGNQISEYFIHELKSVGIPVSDYKVTGFIQVTPNGDLTMSRNLHELKANLNIGYVLTGTLIENERGMVVNARITSLSNNSVIASTTKLIPNLVWR